MRDLKAAEAQEKLLKIGRMAMAVKEKGGDMTATLARIEIATKAFTTRIDKNLKDRNEH